MTTDLETLADDLLGILTANLNTKIAAIEAEKVAAGKGVSGGLASISSDAYYLQSWNDDILQYHPAIFYGIDSVAAIKGGLAGYQVTLFVDVILVDDQNLDNDIWR